MREIKFEVIQNNKIVAVEFCDPQFNCGCWQHYMKNDPDQRIEIGGYEPMGFKSTIRRQYTGLHDKNGKEIYEGDIVILHIFLGVTWKNVVTWNNNEAMFHVNPADLDTDGSTVEIIGNIFENPWLLK